MRAVIRCNVRFPPKADVCSATRHVCFVPIADIRPQGYATFLIGGIFQDPLEDQRAVLGGRGPAQHQNELAVGEPGTNSIPCQDRASPSGCTDRWSRPSSF